MVLNERGMITYGSRNLADFGVYISGNGTFNAPERDVKTVAIPGRNGDLTLDNGRFKNIKIKYPAFIVEDFFMNTEALRNFLATFRGYARLEDSYHPYEYRMARISGAFTVKPEDKLRAGKFDLTFDCMPQRWLKSGEQVLTGFYARESTGSVVHIQNPGYMVAKPLIKVTLTDASTAQITINDVEIDVSNMEGAMYIDCEIQEAYSVLDQSSMNEYLTLADGVFPSLKPGDNIVGLYCPAYEGRIDVEITPRWWIL